MMNSLFVLDIAVLNIGLTVTKIPMLVLFYMARCCGHHKNDRKGFILFPELEISNVFTHYDAKIE